MMRIVLAGHGRFASGVLSGIEMIFGPQPLIEVVEFVDGETKTELDDKMATAIGRLANADEIILLCDVLQGSPFQCAAEWAQRDPRVHVLYGANVAMALEVVVRLIAEDPNIDDLIEAAIRAGREHIGVFDAASARACADDDW